MTTMNHPAIGKEYDATGFIYFNARYYDPAIGRFISEDSVKDGANWYVYANNNPLKYVDPSGLSPISGYVGDTESETTITHEHYTDHEGAAVEVNNYESTSGTDYTVTYVETSEGTDVTVWERTDIQGDVDVSVDIGRESKQIYNEDNSTGDNNILWDQVGLGMIGIAGGVGAIIKGASIITTSVGGVIVGDDTIAPTLAYIGVRTIKGGIISFGFGFSSVLGGFQGDKMELPDFIEIFK